MKTVYLASLTALSIFCIITTAHADSGWVLWSEQTFIPKGQISGTPQWAVVSSAPDWATCMLIMKKKKGDLLSLLKNDKSVTEPTHESLVISLPDVGDTMLRYICLPGNLDPRESKK